MTTRPAPRALLRARLAAAALALGLLLQGLAPALAHPHVWVVTRARVLFTNGSITGIEHSWTFDEYYSQDATAGLDANGDGKLDRQELAELAKINMEGLKEFDYFTYARLGEMQVAFQPPVDYHLEMADKALVLVFTLPLAQPVLADAKGFTFEAADPSLFIAFDLAPGNPVTLGPGAPAGCSAGHPQGEPDPSLIAVSCGG